MQLETPRYFYWCTLGGLQPHPGRGRPSAPRGQGASKPGTPWSPFSPLSPFLPLFPIGPYLTTILVKAQETKAKVIGRQQPCPDYWMVSYSRHTWLLCTEHSKSHLPFLHSDNFVFLYYLNYTYILVDSIEGTYQLDFCVEKHSSKWLTRLVTWNLLIRPCIPCHPLDPETS